MHIESLSIDLSNYCSKQCPFCYNHSNREGNIQWSPSEVIDFATDCISHGVKSVSLGGGEPFEYEGVFDVIDALYPKTYLSVTTNGLPLLNLDTWKNLLLHSPDKVHITIHQPDDANEVMRVEEQIKQLSRTNIKPGVNLLVSSKKLDDCRIVYDRLLQELSPDQIILVPQRFSCTPTPKQIAEVAGGHPFQSPSCLLECKRPDRFCSVSWDKKVNSCSYAGGKERLRTLDWNGMMEALSNIHFNKCP